MSSEDCEKGGDGGSLDLLTISYEIRVSYPRRSGLVEKNNHLRSIYVIWLLFYTKCLCLIGVWFSEE